MITINTILDMRPGAVPKIIHLSQYDSDFSLVFRLHASFGVLNIESGTTAEIRGTKKSGTGYSASATLNTTNNTVTVTGDAQMTAVAGQNIYEIVLIKNNKVLGSANFVLLVERAALDADTITDASVLRELNAIVEGAETATQAAEDAEDAADRAEAAAQSLEIDDTLTQTGQAADAKAVGDAFANKVDKITGKGLSTEDYTTAEKAKLEGLEPGLSTEAKAALLVCLQHVLWSSEDGSEYYEALKEALNITKTLLSITATYISAGQTVYPYDTLDSLKEYITVTAVYSDGTQGSVDIDECTLSGDLSSATSEILITYSEKTAQINVAVTIDPNLVFYLTRGTAIGRSSGFDTGFAPADTNKAVTIIADVTDMDVSRAGTIFSDKKENDTLVVYAAGVMGTSSGGTYTKKYYAQLVRTPTSSKSDDFSDGEHRIKMIVIHEANSDSATLFMSVDGIVQYDGVTLTGPGFVSNNTHLIFASRPGGGYVMNGISHLFNVYDKALTLSEAKILLGIS